MSGFRRCIAFALAAACAMAATTAYDIRDFATGATIRTSQVLRDVRDWMVQSVWVAVAGAFAAMPRLDLSMARPLVSKVQLAMRDYVQRRSHEQKPCKRPTWSLCPSV